MTPWGFSKAITEQAVIRQGRRVSEETLLNSDEWLMDGLSEEGMLLGLTVLMIGACEAYGQVPRDILTRVMTERQAQEKTR